MKNLLLLLAMLLWTAGCQAEGEDAPEEPATDEVAAQAVAFNTRGAPTVQFEVPSMSCESCVAKVTEVMSEQPGVEDVVVDLQTKLATVAINPADFNSQSAIDMLRDYQFDGASVVKTAAKTADSSEAVEQNPEPELGNSEVIEN